MTTYYAGIGGSSGNAGTSWALRKALPSQAYALANGGDTVYVGPGTYDDVIASGAVKNGTSGNPITLIGDYTGANTDGTGGSVIFNNTSGTGANYLGDYNTVRGFVFVMPGTSYQLNIEGKSGCIVEDCAFMSGAGSGFNIRTSSAAHTIRRCMFYASKGMHIYFRTFASGETNAGHVVENCIFLAAGSSDSITSHDIGGVTIRNSIFLGARDAAVEATSLPGGYTAVGVYNCIIAGCAVGLKAGTSGMLVEDYNLLGSNNTERSNVSSGSNSSTATNIWDTRWLHELTLNNGTLVTPFDLDANSALVELNSGSGAPSADIRGTTVQGTYREWGPFEYDSTLDVEAGAGGGSSVYRRVARILGG